MSCMVNNIAKINNKQNNRNKKYENKLIKIVMKN